MTKNQLPLSNSVKHSGPLRWSTGTGQGARLTYKMTKNQLLLSNSVEHCGPLSWSTGAGQGARLT